MNRIIGNIQVTRRGLSSEFTENDMIQYKQQPTEQIIEEQKQETEIQNPYDEMIGNLLKSNIEIYKNGQKVPINDYYGDFKTDIPNYQSRGHIPVKPTNAPVEQVDPVAFFGSSLKGII